METAGLCRCGRRTEAGTTCTFCRADIGWEWKPLPVDVVINDPELSWELADEFDEEA